jgi:signal transduction histidine kinase
MDVRQGVRGRTTTQRVWAGLSPELVSRHPTEPASWLSAFVWFGSLTIVGALGAAAIGYLTARNPAATDAAVALRVVVIVGLCTSAIYARQHVGARMGIVLALVGLWSCVWLLTGSRDSLPFSIGVLCAGLAPTVFCYLMLAFPSGRLESRADRRLLASAGGALGVAWIVAILATGHPPLPTPLVACGRSCPPSVFFVGRGLASVHSVAMDVGVVAWLVLVVGTALQLVSRARGATYAMSRSLVPLAAVAILNAWFVAGFLIGDSSIADAFGDVDVGLSVLIPIAIFAGLGLAQMTVGHALTKFLDDLALRPSANPQELLAAALRDPSLEIAYRRGPAATYVDASGSPVVVPQPDRHRAVTWIHRDGQPVAAVIYDGQLRSLGRYLHAAGQAAFMRMENARLERDLRASMANLAASRARIMEAARTERRRLERDLHDGVQQLLVGLRIRIDLAAETIATAPELGARQVAVIGQEMDQLLEMVRSLARGIYPAILHDLGLGEALRSAARRSPTPTSVTIETSRRYSENVDVAVYFCCIEALQNVTKHAGPDAHASVRLREEDGHLCFDVHDSGSGFDPGTVDPGSGLTNMRDRLEALGGRLGVISQAGEGTTVHGSVPVA